jgi:hypothetical protein
MSRLYLSKPLQILIGLTIIGFLVWLLPTYSLWGGILVTLIAWMIEILVQLAPDKIRLSGRNKRVETGQAEDNHNLC